MRTKIKYTLLALLVTLSLQAQINLVPNPSFEDQISCIDSGTVSSIYYWNNPTSGTPDIHAIDFCNEYQFSINFSLPDNPYFGYQQPRTGLKCAGIAVFETDYDTTTNFDGTREYLQVKLTNPLKPNTIYCVEFYASLANKGSRYSIKDLGIHFNNESVYFDSLDYPVITYLNNNVTAGYYVSDTLSWSKISGTYYATGDEEYILIGNFTQKYQTPFIENYPATGSIVYYYIDDVSVIECDSLTSLEESPINQIIIYPNPAQDYLSVQAANYNNLQVELFDISGRKLVQQQISSASQTIDISSLSNGIYICSLTAINQLIKRQKIIVNR